MEVKSVDQQVVLEYVAREADKVGFIDRITLFGSRAKGNARPQSDYDLAFDLAPDTAAVKWLSFAEKLDEQAPTLCRLSLVEKRQSIRRELLDRIDTEGIVIYER